MLQYPDEFLALRTLQERRQGIHHLLVILERALAQDSQSRRFVMTAPVGTRTHQSAEGVGHGQDAGLQADGLALQLPGIAGTVHTLVHLLDRLYDLQEGRITIGGVDIRSFTRESLRSQIGLVLQEPFLFSQTIRENIAATRPGAPQEELRSAAAIACVDEAICEFPEGYETLVGERGVTLSGGQKQRVAIARMLMQRAPIMVFDDSLSAVDAETDAKIRAALHESLGKATVLLISHRVTTLMQADCILVLDGGRVSELGTHAELIAKPGIYRDIYEIQMSSDDRRLLGKEGV